MNALSTVPVGAGLVVPAKLPVRPLDAVLNGSPEAFGAIYEGKRDRFDPVKIAQAIAGAEAFMAKVAAVRGALQEGSELQDVEEIRHQLKAFVAAWPNASGADLAGYGLQLLADVDERQPCHYALREGLRQVRQTCRFLPSIAEVLAAIDKAQGRIRNAVWHVGQIPAELEKARADLMFAERRAREAAERGAS